MSQLRPSPFSLNVHKSKILILGSNAYVSLFAMLMTDGGAFDSGHVVWK